MMEKIRYISLILLLSVLSIFRYNYSFSNLTNLNLSNSEDVEDNNLNLSPEIISEIIDKVIEDNIASWNDIFKWSKTRNNLSKDLLNIFLTCKQLSAFNTEYLKNKIKKLKDIRFKYLKDKLTKQIISKYNIDSKDGFNNILNNILADMYINLDVYSRGLSKTDLKKIVELIIAGACVDLKDTFEKTALILSVEYNYKNIAKLLISLGSNINLKQVSGSSALILSVFNNRKDIAELLIKAGADVDLCNNYGQTALIIAADFGYIDIVELLIKYKANTNLRDLDGKTALMIAQSASNLDIVKLLSEC